MRTIFLTAIMLWGVAVAQAQTVSQANGQTASQTQTKATGGQANATPNAGTDPLTVATKFLPSGSSPSGGTSGATAGSTGTTASGSTGSISASSSNTSQVPLELAGESSASSTQSAVSTASAPSHSPTSICAPQVPSTDGGSANLTEIAGFSLDGC